jgi:hypothetical protein
MVLEQPGWQLPLLENSALCLRHDGARGTVQLLAVDDEAYALAVAELAGGIVPPSTGVDVRVVMPDAETRNGGSDFEGVASDGSRQVLVLKEGADRVLVFDKGLTAVNRAITLFHPEKARKAVARHHSSRTARRGSRRHRRRARPLRSRRLPRHAAPLRRRHIPLKVASTA